MAWIWENAEWPHFRWHDAELGNRLGAAHQGIGMLRGLIDALGMQVGLETAFSAMSDEVLRSSEIEGVLLNPDQVRSSLAMRLGLPNEGLPTASHYVDGLVDVMVEACTHPETQLTHETLFNWHRALFPAGGDTIGQYRTSEQPMRVISGIIGRETIHYEAPPSNAVPEMMIQYLNWINDEKPIDPLIKAAITGFWFVTIHPFNDGNGRLSRTITDKMLARADHMPHRYYSMTSAIQKKRQAYYQILEQTQQGSMDITPWLLWFLDCMNDAINDSKTQIDHVLKRVRFWDAYRNIPFNNRQRLVLYRFIDHFEGNLTTSKYAKIAKCSPDTALRDIQELISHNILKAEGVGRGTHYVIDEIEKLRR